MNMLLSMAFLMTMAAAAGRGIGNGPFGRAPGLRHPRTVTAYSPIHCAGDSAHDDDNYAGDPGHQVLWVGLTESECTSTTLPLLASYLGGNITTSDLGCDVGPPVLSPFYHISIFSSLDHTSTK